MQFPAFSALHLPHVYIVIVRRSFEMTSVPALKALIRRVSLRRATYKRGPSGIQSVSDDRGDVKAAAQAIGNMALEASTKERKG